MGNIVLVFMLAIIIEGLVEYVKTSLQQAGHTMPPLVIQLVALLAAVGLALLTGADIFAELGLVFRLPVVGVVLTGVFLSRGSNYMSDLIGRLRKGGTEYITLEEGIVLDDKAE